MIIATVKRPPGKNKHYPEASGIYGHPFKKSTKTALVLAMHFQGSMGRLGSAHPLKGTKHWPLSAGGCQLFAGPEGRPQGAILSERARLSCPDIEVQNCEDVCVRSKGHFGAPRVVLGVGRQLDNQTV